ncbi:MAG: MATE family efflux transporter, partial [Intestinibacter sp.]
MKEERVTNMTIGKQIPLLVKFTLPLIGGQMLQQLYVIVDTIIIGQALGVKALAAVGATDWLYWLFLWTAAGFGQGFAIPVAIRFGSNDLAGVRSSIYTSVFTSGFIGVFMAITGVIIAKPLLLLVDTPNELLLHSLNYLKVLYLGIFVVMLYNMSACILRALGDGRTPFIALIISSIINVILDFIFILGFDWGVEGAAVATVISQSIATFYSFCVMFRIKIMRGSFAAWKLSILEVKIHLCKGVPIAFQMLFIALGGILLQSINNQYGVVFVAAVTADNKIFGVLEAVAMSLGYGMT